MAEFIGRKRELASLTKELKRVRSDAGQAKPGRCLLVRGRRRVGKSRLIEEFCCHARLPYVYFTASQQGGQELSHFAEEVRTSDLPGRDVFAGVIPQTWDAALRLLATAIGDTSPCIVVFDEFPYMVDDDRSLEATFQKQWDRVLSNVPVLLIIVGSDLATMESLNTHGRAFFQRGSELVVPPLSPRETADIVRSPSAADAFDAYLITGGLPLNCDEWSAGHTMWEHLSDALSEPTSALIVSAERVLAAEFPTEAQARAVLGEIGAGETTFSNIARASGGMQAMSLHRSLAALDAKRIIAKETPLSTKASKEARYRVADPYLRFWLQFIGPNLAEIERGRGDRVLARIEQNWTTWRGRAIEPVIREALMRLSPIAGLLAADVVGGFWTRTNVPEIDVVGADSGPVAKRISYLGTIKWLERQILDRADINELIRVADAVPGADHTTPLVAISRSGTAKDAGVAVALGPDELIAAW